ncbi:hypothetical protein SISNIDRAFT_482408 [Sistotremastrum niveocremeum HHB9708]|uniref:GIT Spa2 homology (SHD) domain-containing protein n=1 Tax=Sistotremastrum niveocremeum HHB9708 TaxID=1314777 RepID=A0A164Y5X0_9AGAM|nr:hypothetical protein SISNIDRAFT_482408 [Sistotremastrum niveocremeum HHB9708]
MTGSQEGSSTDQDIMEASAIILPYSESGWTTGRIPDDTLLSSTEPMVNAPHTSSSDIFQTCYDELAKFLPTELTEENMDNAIMPKEKIMTLKTERLRDLCTDVYDEVMRRAGNGREIPHFPAPESYRPKRQLARYKLSVMPAHRFKDLCYVVHWELERRQEKSSNSKQPPSVMLNPHDLPDPPPPYSRGDWEHDRPNDMVTPRVRSFCGPVDVSELDEDSDEYGY